MDDGDDDTPRTAIKIEGGSNVRIEGATIRGFERAIHAEDSEVNLHDVRLVDNLVGVEAGPDAEVRIDESYLNNFVADVIRHGGADVEVLRSVAKEVIELTNETQMQVEADLNRQARDVVTAKDEEETISEFGDLSKTAVEYVIRFGMFSYGAQKVWEALTLMAKHAPEALEHLPEG